MGHLQIPRFAAICTIMAVGVLSAATQAQADDRCAQEFSGVRSADAMLDRAVSSMAKHDDSAARTTYAAAVKQLAQSSEKITDPQCEPANYAFTRFAVTLHALVVGTEIDPHSAVDAQQRSKELWRQFYGLVTDDQVFAFEESAYYRRYPAVAQQVSSYAKTISKHFADEERLLHSAQGPGCANPNLAPVALTTATVVPVPGPLPVGTYAVSINVHLTESGRPTTADVLRSSGHAGLDQNVLQASRLSEYVPEIRNCHAVPSTYVFSQTVVIGP